MADLIALVPDYVGQHFDDGPPGHRYRLYLQFWQRNSFAPTQKDKLQALKPACKLPEHAKDLMKALAQRSQAEDSATTCYIEAKSTSPFVTGIGWEHPNENGFAFLDPYGLPYLPGSGVKGVLRLAAEQLALEPLLPHGERQVEGDPKWNMADVWILFGFDANSAIFRSSLDNPMREAWVARRERLINERALRQFIQMTRIQNSPSELLEKLEQSSFRNEIHTQGCLRFWDVIPELAGAKMEVDILNPHYGDYYHKGSTPHDAGQPVPVFFLTVPPGSAFRFRADLTAPHRLTDDQKKSWQTLLNTAFEYAFDWLGLGAKTSVGYGAMLPDREAEQQRRNDEARAAQERAESERLASLSQNARQVEALKDRMAPGNKGRRQSDQLYQQTNQLIKAAADWSTEDRHALRAAAEAIFEHLGLKRNDYKKLIRDLPVSP